MQYKDYYEVLGVPKTATLKEIKSAYRKLTKKYHPDVNKDDPSAESKYRDINEAYEVLGNEENRKKYDQFGANWKHGAEMPHGFDMGDIFSQFGGARTGGAGGPRVHFSSSGHSDFFDMLFGNMGGFSQGFGGGAGGFGADPSGFGAEFGGARPRARRQRKSDLESEVTITVPEAVTGVSKTMTLERREECSGCHGQGVVNGSACLACRGAGFVSVPRRIEVRIPAGVTEGSKVRVRGEGADGGDIYLKVRYAEDGVYTVKGRDIYRDVPVPLYDAILGGQVDLALPSGKSITLKVKPGTQNGKTQRVKEQGIPAKSGAGDLYLRLLVRLPEKLTDEEMELFKKLADIDRSKKA
ncbi:MAG: J domain-containing protein [bacterium]|nr:J domain-containing protein [bacterium]